MEHATCHKHPYNKPATGDSDGRPFHPLDRHGIIGHSLGGCVPKNSAVGGSFCYRLDLDLWKRMGLWTAIAS